MGIGREGIEMKSKTVCFTGHRLIPKEQYEVVVRRLTKVIVRLIQKGYRFFGTGGALGFDAIAAEIVLMLKKQYPFIYLILVIPCLNQEKYWKSDDQEIYKSIRAHADKIVYTSQEYTRGCMHKRNRHLVDHSGICVCYMTNSVGGTAYTVNYARTRGLTIINIAQFHETDG